MTSAEIAELEQLLDAYLSVVNSRQPSTIARRRRNLEGALVRHAEELIAAAKAYRPPFSPYDEVRAR